MMTITLRRNNSKDFPVLAEWKIGSLRYSDVYTTKKAAVDYLTGRFGKVKIVDHIA